MALDATIHATQGDFALTARLVIEPGAVVAVIGPNGSGKSTLLRVLAGLLPIDAGRVTLAGDVLDDTRRGIHIPAAMRPVGVVFQDLQLFRHMSVLDNVAFGLRCRGIPRRARNGAAMELLETVGLAQVADSPPDQLSGGQAQRVALVRALAFRPTLLMLDEPLSAVDAKTRVELRRTLGRDLAAFDGIKLLVTHDPTDALSLADRIVVIEDGRIVQDGTRDDVLLRPRSDYVATFVGVNLYRGMRRDLEVVLANGGRLHVSSPGSGDAIAAVHARAVTLHRDPPHGSARNVWHGRVAFVDATGDVARVVIDSTPRVTGEITWSAIAELGIGPGVEVWASVKATEIHVYAA
jgi:molybdate transport system ATP-binding protein